MASHQIDHLLEQYELIIGFPHAAADDNALPWPGLQGSSDDRPHVVAAVQTEQAGLDANALLSELGHTNLDGIGYWLGVPRPGNPVRIEPDHKDTGLRSCRIHSWTLRPT